MYRTVKESVNKKVNRDLDRDLPVPARLGIEGLKVPLERNDADKKDAVMGVRGKRSANIRANSNDRLKQKIARVLGSARSDSPGIGGVLPRASGGILGYQTGGQFQRRGRGGRRGGYTPQGIPSGYGQMSGMQGYGLPSQITQRRSYVAPEVAQQWADITQGIMDAGTRTYEDVRYQGPQLAGFTPEEQAYKAAMTRIGTGEGPRATRQAEQTIGEAARGIGSVATAAGAPSLLKDADLSPYESQYTQGVIDPQIRAIREAARQQAAELGSSAAQAGAFGGYRHGLQEQAIGQQEIQQIGDVTAKGAEEAFRSAQAAQQQDAAAEAAAREQQMSAFGRLGGMGTSQMQLGQQMGADEMRRLQGMRDAGMDTRRMQQTAFDIQKAEHEKAMQYPEKQLGFMSSMLQQTPYENFVNQGVYTPQAGPTGTMLGAVGGSMGMQNQMGSGAGQAPATGTTATGQTGVGFQNTAAGQNFLATPDLGGGFLNNYSLYQNSPLATGTPATTPAPTDGNYAGGLLGRYGGGMVPHMTTGIGAQNTANFLNSMRSRRP